MGVTIRPPKAEITAENKSYLQTLDTLELLDKAPIDAEHPYSVIASHIHKLKLQYEKLLFLADRYYNKMVDYLKKALIYGHTSRISS